MTLDTGCLLGAAFIFGGFIGYMLQYGKHLRDLTLQAREYTARLTAYNTLRKKALADFQQMNAELAALAATRKEVD